MFKLCFFVPESHVETAKTAIFNVGGGRLGDYDCCAWQTLGEGQFRPLTGSRPFIGKQDEVEHVQEYKVEIICTDEVIESAVAALKLSHPYEDPAFEVYRLEDA